MSRKCRNWKNSHHLRKQKKPCEFNMYIKNRFIFTTFSKKDLQNVSLISRYFNNHGEVYTPSTVNDRERGDYHTPEKQQLIYKYYHTHYFNSIKSPYTPNLPNPNQPKCMESPEQFLDTTSDISLPSKFIFFVFASACFFSNFFVGKFTFFQI